MKNNLTRKQVLLRFYNRRAGMMRMREVVVVPKEIVRCDKEHLYVDRTIRIPSMWTDGDKLFSYGTVIAQWDRSETEPCERCDGEGKIEYDGEPASRTCKSCRGTGFQSILILNTTKYSTITTKHQNLIRVHTQGMKYVEVWGINNVPKNTEFLAFPQRIHL